MQYSDTISKDDAHVPVSTMALVKWMVSPYTWQTYTFFFLTFLGVLAWTASPLMISKMIDRLSETHRVDTSIWWLVAIYALLRFIDEVLWRVSEYLMRSFKPQMIERVRLNLFSAIHKKPYTFFVNSSSGRIGHWINQTVVTTNELVDNTIWTVWGRVIGLIISACFLLTIHWSLALLFVVWLTALFFYNTMRGKHFGELVSLQSDETSKAASMVVDSVSNHVSVRVFNARERESLLLAHQQKKIVRRWRDSWKQNLVTNMVKGQSANVASVIALVLVISLYGKGVIQIGGILLFVAYFGDASTTLWQLAWALDNYYRNFGTIQNALDGLQGEEERQVEEISTRKKRDIISLEFKKLSFFYPEQRDVPVIDSIDLVIPSGEKVGIVGHSGAGKSTFVGLLLGFYDPTSGDILLNGESTTQHDPSYIRSMSSFVPQDTHLFNRTIRENMQCARPDADDASIYQALDQAQARDFVDAMPDGLDTVIGERGVKLSGGQRQRIAIARAILHDTPLLILDEATSALDSVSEQAIQKALHILMENRTSIVIAHRLSTLQHLDKIIVLEGGKIVENGTHKDLLSKGGIYADLWKRQKDGFVSD